MVKVHPKIELTPMWFQTCMAFYDWKTKNKFRNYGKKQAFFFFLKEREREVVCGQSMLTHTRNLSSAFNPSKCTLTAVNTHPEQWAAMLRHPGSSWGFGALLKGLTSVMVLRVERALVIHSPHRQSLPDLGIEPATFGLQVRLSNH